MKNRLRTAAGLGARLSLVTAVALTACMLTAFAHEGSRRAAQSATRTQVLLLGTGTPRPDPQRSGPATAIVVNETPYLIDFGPGVVRRAAEAYDKGIKGLSVEKLETADPLALRLVCSVVPVGNASFPAARRSAGGNHSAATRAEEMDASRHGEQETRNPSRGASA